MTHEEYTDRLRVLRENYERAVVELKLKYANNTLHYRIGDTINGIEIIDIEIARYNGKIECVYFLKNQTSIFQHKLL